MKCEKILFQRTQPQRKTRAIAATVGCRPWIGLVLIWVCMNMSRHTFAADIQIVCNPKIQVDVVNQQDIRKIFLGKMLEWENHVKVEIVLVKTKPLYDTFLDRYVNMTSSKYRTYWKQMIFTGKSSSSPKTLDTEEDVLHYIAETEGAIGYVSVGAQTENVKVLIVSERKEGE